MGNTCGERTATKKLRVMTLNYCGISYSPFQFYISDYEPQLTSLGKKFQDYIKKEQAFYDKGKDKILVSQRIGKVEKQFKKGRYSPLIDLEAGIKIKQTNQFNTSLKPMNQDQFKKEWQKGYQKQYEQLKRKCRKIQNFDEQVQYIKTYDFLAYKAFIRYVYNQTLEEVLKENKKLDKYYRVLEPFFDFSFLSEENKLSKFKYGYLKNSPDLFFVQDYSDHLFNFLKKKGKKNFFWFHNEDEDQLIILKRQAFGFDENSFKTIDVTRICPDDQEYQKAEDAAKNKLFAVQSDHFLIVSMFLSSSSSKGVTQRNYLTNFLTKIHQLEEFKKKTVIFGGDINQYYSDVPKGFQYFPQKQEEITTYKKRTALQVQIQKKDVVKKKSIDKIITNQKIVDNAVTLIDGELPDINDKNKDWDNAQAKQRNENGNGLKSKVNMLLPCDTHPFDQFIVRTDLEIPDYETIDRNTNILQGLVGQ